MRREGGRFGFDVCQTTIFLLFEIRLTRTSTGTVLVQAKQACRACSVMIDEPGACIPRPHPRASGKQQAARIKDACPHRPTVCTVKSIIDIKGHVERTPSVFM